jgi:hypothetical protein
MRDEVLKCVSFLIGYEAIARTNDRVDRRPFEFTFHRTLQ